jgi:hypothetical protein
LKPPKHPIFRSEAYVDELIPEGRGARFLAEVAERYEGEPRPDETALLRESARLLDVIDELAEVVARDGTLSTGSRGQVIVHPALQELRSTTAELRQHCRQLGLPNLSKEE